MSLFCYVILYLEVLGNLICGAIYIKQEKELREFSKGVFYMVKAALIAHALFGPEKSSVYLCLHIVCPAFVCL